MEHLNGIEEYEEIEISNATILGNCRMIIINLLK